MKYFRDLCEEQDSNEFGFSVYGEAMTLQIKQAKYNDLMDLTFSGQRVLLNLPSAEHIKSDYKESDHYTIDETYKKIIGKLSKDTEKLVKAFEKDLNKLISTTEKQLKKF